MTDHDVFTSAGIRELVREAKASAALLACTRAATRALVESSRTQWGAMRWLAAGVIYSLPNPQGTDPDGPRAMAPGVAVPTLR